MISGTALYALSQWVIALALARVGGPDAVGIFAVGSAISMPLVVASQFALRQVLIADVLGRHEFVEYLRLRVVATVPAFALILGVSYALGYRDTSLVVISAVAAGRCFESVSDIHYGEMQRAERFDLIAKFMTARGALCAVSVALALFATQSVSVAALAFTAACAVSTVFVDRVGTTSSISSRARDANWNLQSASSLAIHSAPLAAFQVLNNINANAPRYVLAVVGGSGLVGQFAVVEHFAALVSLAVMSLGQSFSPRLARHYSGGDGRAFQTLALRYVAIVVAISLCAFAISILAGEQIVTAIYGTGFRIAGSSFSWIMFASIFSLLNSAMGYIVPSTGIYGGLVWRQLVITAISISASAALAPSYGLVGIALGTAFGQAVGVVLLSARLVSLKRRARTCLVEYQA